MSIENLVDQLRRRPSTFELADALVDAADRWGLEAVLTYEELGLSYQTVSNWLWVARAIPPERRRVDLSFSHHGTVASLPPAVQDALLAQAAEEGWTNTRLRAEVRSWRRSKDATGEQIQTLGHLEGGTVAVLQ